MKWIVLYAILVMMLGGSSIYFIRHNHPKPASAITVPDWIFKDGNLKVYPPMNCKKKDVICKREYYEGLRIDIFRLLDMAKKMKGE